MKHNDAEKKQPAKTRRPVGKKGATNAAPGGDPASRPDGQVGSPPPGGSGFLIVAIGASAGGLEALGELLEHMPPDPGMPASAEATGLADYVVGPASMPKQLIAYARGAFLSGKRAVATPPLVRDEAMQKMFLLLRNRSGHDFYRYKTSTVRRRIERRMNLQQLRDPDHYVRFLRENAHEIDLLFRELLISVTSFFRDPAAWEALAAGCVRTSARWQYSRCRM